METNNPTILTARTTLFGSSPQTRNDLSTADGGTVVKVGGQPEQLPSKGLHELQDRFAIIPLYTSNYKYALPGEYMIDPTSGAAGIKLEDGRVVMVDEEGRFRYHVTQFENELCYYGMRQAIIKKAIYDDDSYIHTYKSGKNLLDDPIYIDDQEMIKKLAISLDLDILTPVDGTPKLQMANIDPKVIVKYTIDMGQRKEFTCKLSELRTTVEEMQTVSLSINEIILPSDIDCVLEECLILIHSILIGVIEESLG